MRTYTKDDLQIVTGAVAVIQKNPRMYLGSDEATGEHLAAKMMSSLIWLGALPAKVSKHGPWWVVSSQDDWLVKSGQANVEVAFSQIVPLPGVVNHIVRRFCGLRLRMRWSRQVPTEFDG